MIEMGSYYYDKHEHSYGQIKVICRGYYHWRSDTPMIAFVQILEKGCVSDVILMEEREFRKIFIE